MSEEVVGKLAGKEEKINELVQRYDSETVLEVVLTISLNEELSTPAIGFSKKVVRFMAEVGGFIDVDTYRGES
jgi:starvation-inducible outer membrane lipoprotein